MKKVFNFVGLFLFFAIGLFTNCEVGLGDALDLEAPELTITSPETLSKVKRAVTVKGTCVDNVKVTAVKVSNRITGENYGNANLSGSNWEISLFLPEGEVELLISAEDAARNTSIKSSKTLMLLVDETAPEGLSWYVDRGDGVQVGLMSKQALTELRTDLAKNKHIPQNEEFTVYGRFYDAMSIDTITLIISEDGNFITSKTVTAEDKSDGTYVGDGKSIYAPSWKFTQDELVAAKSELSTGKHYLNLSYYSSDEHLNSATRPLSYMFWYPESDKPGIQQAATMQNDQGEDILSVNVGSQIPLHFFDDDELIEVAYDFIAAADFFESKTEDGKQVPDKTKPKYTLENLASKKGTLRNTVSGSDLAGRTDWPLQVSAGETTGEYYLVAYAKDANSRVSPRTPKENGRIIKTTVADASMPLLIIEKPEENNIPTIKDGTISTFEFSGYSYDTSGSNRVKIAYIPGKGAYDTAAKREARAKELFADNANDNKKLASGEIIKAYKFPASKSKGATDQWYIEPFTFEFDVLTDFGSEIRDLKFFEIMLEDTDGNKVYKQFNVAADTVAPDIVIASPSEDMGVCDYKNNDLTLKFKATKVSRLGIVPDKYKIVRKDHEEGTSKPLVWTTSGTGDSKLSGPDAEGYYSVTIPKATLKKWAEGEDGYKVDVQPVFKFYAEDVLGNYVWEQRTVVLSPLPALETVTVDLISGTYPARNEPVSFQVKFSDSVRVTGKPRLKLAGLKPAGDYYAVYDTGSGTDTLTFKWEKIPTGVYTEGTTILSIAGGKIDLNGGKIETGVAGKGDAGINFVSGQNFWDSTDTSPDSIKREIKIDGIAPTIDSITASVDGVTKNADGNFYVNENREIVLSVKFTEKVLVTGNPVLKCGSFKFNLLAVSGDTVKFSHKVAENENGEVACNLANCFSADDLALIKDEAGNSMVKGSGDKKPGVIIDTVKPGVPSISEVINGSYSAISSIYNYHPKIAITKNPLDADAVEDLIFEYSLDGGLSWATCTEVVTVADVGSHIITARVKDKASNVSEAVPGIAITINDTFPTVDEISIAKADGKYLAGEKIDFKVFLRDVVEPFAASSASDDAADQVYIVFTDKNGANDKKVYVNGSSTRTNKLVFTHTVGDEEYNGVYIKEVHLGKIKDRYDNHAGDHSASEITKLIGASTNNKCKRDNLVLDGKLPYVQRYKLGTTSIDYPETGLTSANAKVSECENNAFKITLQFNENLVKESGTIILKRKGKWAIPPVMDTTEFDKWYSKMTVANRNKMVTTVGNTGEIKDIALDSLTGMPVGPYQKITHGLKNESGKAVPDTDTKYVLAFKYGLYDDLDATDKTVSDIRAALSSVDYDKYTLEVNTAKVNLKGSNSAAGKTSDIVEIDFTGTTVADGQEWELIIPSTAFHDTTGNSFAGFKSSNDAASGDKTFVLWSDKVSKPVVRVDRYSHGMGAYGLNGTTKTLIDQWTQFNSASTTSVNSGRFLKPLGYANVRIDCETPGATIKYTSVAGGTAKYTDYAWTTDSSNENDSHHSTIPDVAMTSLDIVTGGTTYASSSVIPVGGVTDNTTDDDTARFKTASKDYVTAYATKDSIKKASNTSIEKSDAGYEGIFKTVIIIYKSDSANQINIEGGTKNGGEPYISGFPLRDATTDNRYSKNTYLYKESNNNYFSWVSYEIVSTDFAVLQHRSNYSSQYPKHSYGQLLYLYNYSIWE